MMLSAVVLVLLQICSLQMMVASRPTCKMDGDLVKRAHDALRDMGGSFTFQCMQYNENVTFPRSILSTTAARGLQCRRVFNMLNETLWEAGEMFYDSNVTFPDQWEEKVDDFEGMVDRVVGDKRCSYGSSGVLTPYFSSVKALLVQEESSMCGWMAMKRDLLWFLKSTLHTHHACFAWRSNSSKIF